MMPRTSIIIGLLAIVLGGCATPAAAFDVSDLAVTTDRSVIHLGDEVEVTASVLNSGTLAGSYQGELLVDGVAQGRGTVTLDPGQAATIRFAIRAGPPGDHEITLGAATATLHVTAAPAFGVSGLRLASMPPEILPGDRLEYLVEVANTGARAGTYDAEISVDATVRSRQSVVIGVGQTTTVRFVIEAGASGVHAIAVAGERTMLTVLEPASVAVTALQVTPDHAEARDQVAAAVTLGNRGGATGTLTIDVTIDGKVAATREVTVAGGEQTTIEIPLSVPAPGRHTVAVGSLDRELVVWKITRPANGTVLVNRIKGGMGRLTIKNGDEDRDAVVVLASSSKPSQALLAVYVRANKSSTIKTIKDGTYVLYFTHGERWDSHSRSFTSSQERRRFEAAVRFKTTRTSTYVRYSVVTISLHQVVGGNAPTDPVEDEDFPTVP